MPQTNVRRSLIFRLSSILIVSLLSSACGEDPDAPVSGDPGGSAGATGGSNASGAGGAGAAGSSGKAGHSTGGTAGASGQGSGGDSGQAGDAGSGGISGGAGETGAGGLGGAGEAGSGNEAGAGGDAGDAGSGGSGVGGDAGAGGSGGDAGAGGSGGGQCSDPSECPGTDDTCQFRTCESGQCGVAFANQGVQLPGQNAGDCKVDVCDGNGSVVTQNDDVDAPVSANSCVSLSCSGGSVVSTNVAAGEACGDSLKCNGDGNCVGCLDASDCPGVDTECQVRACSSGVCSVVNTPDGTLLSAQIAGDCLQAQCNGDGGIKQVPANDPLDDGKECTTDSCNAGVPQSSPKNAGTSCTEGGGSVCDGGSNCVECLDASSCPQPSGPCQIAACVVGSCSFSNVAAGTVIADQTVGDCKENQCDGAGSVVVLTEDSDLPADSNPCTQDVCTSGAPSNPPVSAGTNCGGTNVCNAQGQCVGCNAPSDCPGTDTECQTRTCTAGVCGFSFTAAGTPVASQTAGDCKENQCNGSGNIVSTNKNADLPVDGNSCTQDVCTNGVPSNPPQSSGASCNQNGGKFCNGASTCVQCVAAADCPGVDTECQSRTCNAGVCGFNFTATGTPVASQTAGDCKRNECNGAGAIVAASFNTDLPVDGKVCTQDVCTNGVPSNPPVSAGTNCGGTNVCNAQGQCVGCNAPSDCPGTDTECQTRTCTAGVCGFNFTATGTPVASQTAGDCKENQCDGSGNIVSVNQSTDLPSDDGNTCTNEVCSAGTPTHPPLPAGTACNQNGGAVCSSTATCVQCISASQCPQPSDPCLQALCSGNLCGVGAKTDGTACSVGGESGSCSVGSCKVCNAGAKRCKSGSTNAPQLCNASGQWSDLPVCGAGMTCSGGACLSCGDGAYAGMVSNLGAISYWSMDETGNTFADSIGGRNGNAVGTFSKGVTGLLVGGKSAEFSGGGAVSVPYSSALAATSFTVAAWVKVNGMAGSTRDIVSTRTFSNQGWELRVGGANLNQFQMTTFSPGNQTVLNGPVFQLGTTYFVAGSYDSATGSLKLYVDGELKGTTSTPLVPSPSPFDIGQILDGQNKFIGVLDGVSFFDRALSAQDIKNLHGAGSCACTPGSASCNGNQLLSCNASGQFDPPQSCGGSTPYCDAANPKCVQCTSASQCPQPSDPCLQALCSGNLCGVGAKTNGTACSVGGELGSCLAGNCQTSMASCSAVKSLHPGAPDGLYKIDPDGGGPIPPVNLFCDMSGGGSTLVANIFDSSGDDCPNATSFVASGWQQSGSGSWASAASVVNRDSSGTGSAAVSLGFVAALKANAGQKHLKICLVQPNGSDGVCRGSADGSISLVYNADTANPKLTQYAGNTLVYTFGRLAGLAGTRDDYSYGQLSDGGASIPKTPGAQQEFGTSNVLAEYPGNNYYGVWHGGGYGISYRPSLTNSEEVGPSTLFSGFRLYISP